MLDLKFDHIIHSVTAFTFSSSSGRGIVLLLISITNFDKE